MDSISLIQATTQTVILFDYRPRGGPFGTAARMPLEGPGVTFPELVGVADFDTGVPGFSICKGETKTVILN